MEALEGPIGQGRDDIARSKACRMPSLKLTLLGFSPYIPRHS
jgi:hypothetical protein